MFVLAATGCASLSNYDETTNWDAAKFYNTAKDALKDGDYAKAIQYYTKLEARYPYGRYTEQAQLETAYAHYKAHEWSAAIEAADRFIRLHPRNPNVDYAYYMRGLASFEPDTNFLERMFPQDMSQRDPSAAHESFRYFNELIQRFPHSKYAADAKQRMVYLRNSLARYEIKVAAYYLRRGAYLAAANRGKYVVEHYPQTPAVADALVVMIKAYRLMNETKLADDTARVLAKNYPDRAAALVRETLNNTYNKTP